MYSACYTSTIFFSLNIHTYGRVLWWFISNKFTVGLGLLVTISYALIVWRWAAYHKQSAFVVIVYIYRWARVSLCEEHAAITGKLGKKIDLNTTSHIYPARGLTSEREKTHTHTRLSYELLYSSNSGAFSLNEGWSLRSRFLWTLFFINFWHNKGNNNWSKQRGGEPRRENTPKQRFPTPAPLFSSSQDVSSRGEKNWSWAGFFFPALFLTRIYLYFFSRLGEKTNHLCISCLKTSDWCKWTPYVGSNGQTACLLKRRKIIDVRACRECFCLVFKVFPRLRVAEEHGEEERSGQEQDRNGNDMVGRL